MLGAPRTISPPWIARAAARADGAAAEVGTPRSSRPRGRAGFRRVDSDAGEVAHVFLGRGFEVEDRVSAQERGD